MLKIFTVEPLQGGVHFGACRLRQLFHGTYVRPGSVFHTHAPRLHVCVACGFAASIIVTWLDDYFWICISCCFCFLALLLLCSDWWSNTDSKIFETCVRQLSHFANGTLTWFWFLKLRHYSHLMVVNSSKDLAEKEHFFSSLTLPWKAATVHDVRLWSRGSCCSENV